MAIIRSGWVLQLTTNRHGVTTFNFTTVSCCELVVSSSHVCGATLNLLMTDVADLVRVAVVHPH